jgi:hypothetical protein
MNIGSGSQPTDFALDVLGRYVCNTFDEAMANSDFGHRAGATDRNGNALPPRGDMRPFDFIIIGGGTFGAAAAEQLWFRTTGRSERILVLEAGPFFLAEHQQNLPSLGLGNEVWGLAWNADPALGYPGLSYCVGVHARGDPRAAAREDHGLPGVAHASRVDPRGRPDPILAAGHGRGRRRCGGDRASDGERGGRKVLFWRQHTSLRPCPDAREVGAPVAGRVGRQLQIPPLVGHPLNSREESQHHLRRSTVLSSKGQLP